MSNVESYNKAYLDTFQRDFNVSTSLQKVLDHRLTQVYLSEKPNEEFDFLEVGCGRGSQYLYWKQKPESCFVEAFDWSEVAIKQAREKLENAEIKFSVKNAANFEYPQQFDFVLDSHLLHCLVDAEIRVQYLRNVFEHLKEGGLFLGECMIEHKGFSLNDVPEVAFADKVIYYRGEPQRYLCSSFEIEEILIGSGFRIEFFYIPYGLRVVPLPYRENAISTDPEIVRFIARKI